MTSSYGVELIHVDKIFDPTLRVFRSAVSYLLEKLPTHWSELSKLPNSKQQLKAVEKLIHTTVHNQALYDFDKKFYKMPPYFRRSAINTALGALSSYYSNLKNWEENKSKKKGKKPTLQVNGAYAPCFYKGDYQLKPGSDSICLKIYRNNDWVWYEFRLKSTDMKYIRTHCSEKKQKSPVLEKKHGKYFLRFAFEFKMGPLTTKTPLNQTICAVDLGINTDAVCSIMDSTGTVMARKFIDFPIEKDRLFRVLNRIKKFQHLHGSHDVGSFWSYARRLNDELAKKIAHAIVDYASENHVNTIVFEYLNFHGKVHGSKKQKIIMWKKNSIQNIATAKAHEAGIRISRICAANTSKLAFDGSGEVHRDDKNYSLCTFKTGKQYNCDLNASYNIGARFFIRAILKSIPETELSDLQAKCPDCRSRRLCTLSTLRALTGAKAA